MKVVIIDNIFIVVKVENGIGNEFGVINCIKNGGVVVLKMNFIFLGKNYKVGDIFKMVLLDLFNFGMINLIGDFLFLIEVKWDLNVSICELIIIFFKDGV